jgi:signal transduction histidine kinase
MTAALKATLDSLAERLDEPVVRLDAHRRIVFANAAFVRVFGTAPGSIAALAVDDAAKASLIAALSAANEAELPLTDAQGQLILVSIDSMRCGDGHVAVLRPRSTAASRAADFFLAAASHELRTPLNAILGFAQMIARGVGGPATDKQREYAESIETAAKMLMGIFEELLDVARDDASADRVNETPIDLAALARAQIDLVRPQASEADVALAMRHPPASISIVGDARKLAQAVLNLLANAVKFTPKGSTVTLGVERAPDGDVLLWVADQGPGIPSTDVRSLGENPRPLDAGFVRRTPGTGLGLAIVRRYTDLHGGRLEIGTGENDGARVTIRLPAERALDAAQTKRAGLS